MGPTLISIASMPLGPLPETSTWYPRRMSTEPVSSKGTKLEYFRYSVTVSPSLMDWGERNSPSTSPPEERTAVRTFPWEA